MEAAVSPFTTLGSGNSVHVPAAAACDEVSEAESAVEVEVAVFVVEKLAVVLPEVIELAEVAVPAVPAVGDVWPVAPAIQAVSASKGFEVLGTVVVEAAAAFFESFDVFVDCPAGAVGAEAFCVVEVCCALARTVAWTIKAEMLVAVKVVSFFVEERDDSSDVSSAVSSEAVLVETVVVVGAAVGVAIGVVIGVAISATVGAAVGVVVGVVVVFAGTAVFGEATVIGSVSSVLVAGDVVEARTISFWAVAVPVVEEVAGLVVCVVV